MLNAIIRFALQQRLLVLAFSLFLLGFGGWQATRMDIDVFPDLNRPRVVVMTEAPGMAPEEVEALITFPLETALNGATGVETVRTSSGVGISVIYVEFDWGTNIYDDRQIVMERIQLVQERLPNGIQPTLAPISSIMGQIVMMGMWSQENDQTRITSLPGSAQEALDAGRIPQVVRNAIEKHGGQLSAKATVQPDANSVRWVITAARHGQRFPVHRDPLQLAIEYKDNDTNKTKRFLNIDVALSESLERGKVPPEIPQALRKRGVEISESIDLAVEPQTVRWLVRDDEHDSLFVVRKDKGRAQFDLHRLTSDLQLRTLADWRVRQKLLAIPGVSQVFTMGGGRKQFQVLVDPDALLRYGITLHDVKKACTESNQNATGGYLDEQGPNELLVRSLGRVQSVEDLRKVVVTIRKGRPVTLRQIARVAEGSQVKRGDSSAFRRNKENGSFSGGPAVVLTINKQPDADTRSVTDEIIRAVAGLELPADVRVEEELYSQKSFIDRAIENVAEALRDGGILVVIILFLFLMNFRTTFITLTAIPMSIAITAIIFTAFDLSINTMTLGGLAIAIGELVDDAIVDVENIFRRLKENRHSRSPKHPLLVVFQASVEIRNSIVFGTIIVVLVFVPLFALSGMEGRLFTPLGVAYIVSILSSLLVSLTLTPVLSYWLLGRARLMEREKDGPLLRFLKWVADGAIHTSIRFAKPVLVAACVSVVVAFVLLINRERDFLPPFNEGSGQLNVILPPGTSLATSNEIAGRVEQRLMQLEDVRGFVRRTGRAELDEHAEGVNTSEFVIDLNPDSRSTRQEQLDAIREAVKKDVPGAIVSAEQPLAHLISHMISGIKAQVGIKIYGDDLDALRQKAQELKAAMEGVPGVINPYVEPQVIIPQLRIQLDRDKLESYGLTPAFVNEYIKTAMNGQVVSEVLIGQRTFDLLVRMEENYREDRQVLKRLAIDLPGGGTTPLSSLARIYESGGPNTINRERVRRRIAIQCNVSGRGLVDVVQDIRARHQPIIAAWKEPGYDVEYAGQFKSAQDASRVIYVLFGVSLLGIFLVLYTMFRSANFALQVMAALPMAFIGSVAALVLTDQKLTVASMVGFISLGGIASRNGILLLNHYLHLVRYEGESWTREMLVRAGKERLAPVLMTALTSGIGLVPLALAAGEPGKEILYPVATVIIGGLLSSTILEFLVRPALFWTFGCHVGERLVAQSRTEVPLVEESEMHRAQQIAGGYDANFRPEEGRAL